MPEGDTIFRLAEQLRPKLLDAEVRRLHLHRTPPTRLPKLPTTVDEVRAVGKHLLITFGTGHVFDSHLKMNGSWDIHRPGGRWREPRGAMRALIETDEVEAVLFSTRDVRIYDPRDTSTKPWERLGPDLCLADVDVGLAVERARWLPDDTEIAEVLLDQRPACGIGNVYKSEVLWAERIHPRTRLAELDDDTLHRLYATANRLLRANLSRSKRVTHGRGLAVYGRERSGCPRCHGRVRFTKQGGLDRSTYWCERCQVRA